MKRSPGSPRGFAPVLILLALLGGCATVPPNDCDRFRQLRRTTDYDTTYVYSAADSREAARSFARSPRKASLTARWYTIRTNRPRIGGCDHLYLLKDLYLQRRDDAAVVLEEQREFYTADGQLIATKREDVSAQLTKTGYYTASVPLPIPEKAPPGQYRVVTRLITRGTNGAEQTLATASAEFRVGK